MSVPGAAFAAAAQLAEPLLSMAFLMYAYRSRAAAAPEGSGESSSKKKVFCANDIKSIGMSKETTIVFLRGYAENVLSRARQHIAGNAHGAKLMDQDNALAGAFGRLDVGVAECFATNNKKVRTDMLDGIALAWAGEFADEFQNAYGANSLVKKLEDMGLAPQEAKAKEAKAKKGFDVGFVDCGGARAIRRRFQKRGHVSSSPKGMHQCWCLYRSTGPKATVAQRCDEGRAY